MILDYMFTYGGPELFMLATFFVVTPLFYSLFLRRAQWRYRLASIAAVWLVALITSLGDVFLIARQAQRLCSREAGIHVYSRRMVVGVSGLFDIAKFAGLGVRFVEYRIPGSTKLYREVFLGGEVIRREIEKFISPFEYVTVSEDAGTSTTRLRDIIQDAKTKKPLGEIVSFKFYPGWVDRRLIGLSGFNWSPPICDGNIRPEAGRTALSIFDLINAVTLYS